MQIEKFLTSISEEVKRTAKIKVLKTTMAKAIAEAEEEVAIATSELELFQMQGTPQEMINSYLALQDKIESANADLVFKKKAEQILFGE